MKAKDTRAIRWIIGALVLAALGLSGPISIVSAAGWPERDDPPLPAEQTVPITPTLPPVSPVEYWTEERMRSAQPYPMEMLSTPPGLRWPDLAPQAAGEPGWAPSLAPDGLPWAALTNNPPITTPLPGFTPTWSHTTTYLAGNVADITQFPYSTLGKVFFVMGGRNFVCSAAVIGEHAIWTAAHCVNNGRGVFHTNWLFVPAFHNFTSPFTGWVADYFITSNEFSANMDLRFDYAVAIVSPPASAAAGLTVRQLTGALGFAWNVPREQAWVAMGYPQLIYGGLRSVISYGAYGGVDTSMGAPYPFGIGSAIKSGGSGGPWLLNIAAGRAGEANYLGGVNSYINLYADELYSPYLDDRAKRLWDCAQASTPEQLDCGAAPMTAVALTKLSSSDSAAPGAPFTYTLVIHNHGTITATDLALIDTLPTGVALASAALPEGDCTAAGSVVTCTLSALLPGAGVTATLAVTAPNESGLVTNSARVSFDPGGELVANYYPTTASVTTAIQEADLALDKAASPEAVVPGALLTYTLTIHNRGPLDAANVVLTDTLPPETAFVSAALPGGNCGATGGVVTCTLSALPNGESIAATLVVTAPGYAAIITNSASVTADQIDVQPDDNLNIRVATPVEEANLALALSSSHAAVQAGAPLTYWLTLENWGPLAATNIEFDNSLPPGFTFASADLPGGACGATGSVVTCTLDMLAGGGSVTATVVATAPVQGGIFTDTATVYFYEYDATPEDNSASLSVRVDACWARLNDNDTNYYPLQAALDAAQSGDVVKVAGTCAGAIQRPALSGYNGIPTFQTAYVTQSLTLRGGYTVTDWTTADAAAHPTALDALGQGRAFLIGGEGISVTVEGLRFTGGNADHGGGGMVFQAGIALRNTTFDGNDGSAEGGGLYVLQSQSANLSHNTFRDNITYLGEGLGGGGAALSQCPNASLSDNFFDANDQRNFSSAGSSSRGAGGLYVQLSDQVVVRRNTFTNNRAEFLPGGGMYLRTSRQATVSGNLFISNTATGEGGGLYVGDCPTVTLANNRFLHNHADFNGGGMFLNASPNATFINTLVAQNTITPTVSDLYIRDSSARLLHTTLAGSGIGQGLYVNSNSTAALTNTILDSYETGLWVEAGGAATVDGVLWNNVTPYSGTVTVTNETTGDPAFVDPANDDYHLGVGSAAIDMGVDAGVTTDIDGNLRPQGAGYDLGAYEAPQPALRLALSVTPTDNVPYHGLVTYTIILSNVGELSDPHVLLTDTLPTSVNFASWVISPANTLRDGNTITWTGTVTAGQALTWIFRATHTGSYGEMVINTAYFSGTVQTGHSQTAFSAECSPGVTVQNTDDSGAGSLRQAIVEVCAGHTIDFAASLAGQTITLSRQLDIDKDITIDGSGLAQPVILSGNDAARVILVTNGARVTLSHLTLAHGQDTSTECWDDSCGGGLKIDAGAAVTLTHSAVLSSTAASGGGISNYGALMVMNSTLAGNSAYGGSGIYNTEGTLTVMNSTLAGNSAGDYGGGIENEYGAVTVMNSTLAGNSAGGYGGGIDNNGGILTITNSTLSGNQIIGTEGYEGGGAIDQYSDGFAAINYSTIVANIAVGPNEARSGIWLESGTLLLHNSIVANNNGSNNFQQDGGVFTSQGYNLANAWNGLATAATDLTGDPLLDPLADNGPSAGSGQATLTHALRPGSPAIDAADPVSCLATDQRGEPRLAHYCDIGAYEASAALRMTKQVEGPDGAANMPLGGVVTYTLVIHSEGVAPARGVVVTDVLPAGLTFGDWLTGTLLLPPDHVHGGPWDIAAGAQVTFCFTAILTDSGAWAGQTITNTAWYTSDNAGGGSASAAFTVANRAPVADAGIDQTVAAGALVALDGRGSADPDGQPLRYAWQQTGGLPLVTLSSADVVTPTFSAPATSTVLTFTLTVTDTLGLGSTPDTVVITVESTVINHPPVADAGIDQTVTTGALVTLDGRGSADPDGQSLRYAWRQTGGLPLVTLSSADVVTPTFSTPAIPTVLTFTLTVTDTLGLGSTPDTVVITVKSEFFIYLPLVMRQG